MTNYVNLTAKESEDLAQLMHLTACRYKKELMEKPALDKLCVRVFQPVGGYIECAYRKVTEVGVLQAPEGAVAHEVVGGCEVTCTIVHPNGTMVSTCKFYMGFDETQNQPVGIPLHTDIHPACLQGKGTLSEYIMENSRWALHTVLLVQAALLHHNELLTFTTEFKKKEQKPGKKVKKKGQRGSTVHKVRVYHLVPLDADTVSRIKRNQAHKINCPAWGVRGHYRHYKSGKVVYIQPHVRGKQKELYQGREYSLLPRAQHITTAVTQ